MEVCSLISPLSNSYESQPKDVRLFFNIPNLSIIQCFQVKIIAQHQLGQDCFSAQTQVDTTPVSVSCCFRVSVTTVSFFGTVPEKPGSW